MRCNYRQVRSVVNIDALRLTLYARRYTPNVCHCERKRSNLALRYTPPACHPLNVIANPPKAGVAISSPRCHCEPAEGGCGNLIRHLPSVIRYPSSVIRYLSSVICHQYKSCNVNRFSMRSLSRTISNV